MDFLKSYSGIIFIFHDMKCLGQTWYLANDMQMFLIAPPIIYITWRWRNIGLALIGESIYYIKYIHTYYNISVTGSSEVVL